ncbi:MAG: Glycosyl transferase [Nitrospira sp.]|nr:hypothetical protein [Nitrospira sp.]ULA60224.1 MAG: Glycosyl transferase [Nitrospira sp.]
MDGESYDLLTRFQLPYVQLISIAELEAADPELSATKATRSRIEYYFTCSPSLPLYILRSSAEIDVITYVDADLYFFSDAEPVFQAFTGNSIGVTGHRFAKSFLHLEEYGRYNVGWLMFRNNQEGLACLKWWRQRCLEWCYDRSEAGRFADQKYLDEWPSRFPGVIVLDHAGLNAAPWNLGGTVITQTEAGIQIDGQPLVAFHFHGFKRIRQWLYDPNLSDYQVQSSIAMRRGIFAPYLREMAAIEVELKQLHNRTSPVTSLKRGSGNRLKVVRPENGVRRWLRVGRRLIMGQYLVQVNGHVL